MILMTDNKQSKKERTKSEEHRQNKLHMKFNLRSSQKQNEMASKKKKKVIKLNETKNKKKDTQ